MDLCSAIIHRTTVQIIHIFHHLKNVGEFLCFLDRGVNKCEYFFSELETAIVQRDALQNVHLLNI